MQATLETFLAGGVLAFLLTFTRVGTAVMIMPGLGDSFVSDRIRLHIALAFSFVLFPFIMPYVPKPLPDFAGLVLLIAQEMMIGLLIGTVSRIFMTALDTAGMLISAQSGLANAQVFNPSLASQGSLIGAFMSVTGVLILFATNMHHLLIRGIVDSYNAFPIGQMPLSGDMADVISRAVSASFLIGVKLATPFVVLTLLIYVGMGVLSRLMPQVQVFILALPIQLLLSILTLFFVLGAMFSLWLSHFEQAMVFFFSNAG